MSDVWLTDSDILALMFPVDDSLPPRWWTNYQKKELCSLVAYVNTLGVVEKWKIVSEIMKKQSYRDAGSEQCRAMYDRIKQDIVDAQSQLVDDLTLSILTGLYPELDVAHIRCAVHMSENDAGKASQFLDRLRVISSPWYNPTSWPIGA